MMVLPKYIYIYIVFVIVSKNRIGSNLVITNLDYNGCELPLHLHLTPILITFIDMYFWFWVEF
jgi:hypothetical protein